jgi:predicted metalloprotease with PDZ domain
MTTIRVLFLFSFSCLSFATPSLTFTVSMTNPAAHTFHIRLHATGVAGPLQDFKMPQWSPGFYVIQDYARSVSGFRATGASGQALAWEKTTPNTWRIVTVGARDLQLDYDVFGATAFAAANYLGEDRAFLSPAGLFVYPVGQLGNPVTVELQTPAVWPDISTGLDAVEGKPGTFQAASFDVLYDSRILVGKHERLQFTVGGVPHYVAIEDVPESVSRLQMLADLKAIVTVATRLFADIPYRQYTFLLMGRGGGGIEHANSSADQFDGASLTKSDGYGNWLSFIAHEYFHSFNVKRIRPLALGPFDYDQENVTSMLWVSEGLSVYYEDVLLVRAGLLTRDHYLRRMASGITSFENAPGRNYQSATESSRNAWNSGSGIAGDRNTTISYYDNGAMLGAMLDLSIRAATDNRHSLDDVMRTLYRKFYLEQKRGFTDAEFRAVCEEAAGGSAPVAAVFDYASTTREIDFAGHFALAGLRLDLSTETAPGGSIGLHTSTREIPVADLPPAPPGHSADPAFQLLVTDTVSGSSAAKAGLLPGDRIVRVDGLQASATILQKAIQSKSPGEFITLVVVRSGEEREVAVEVALGLKRTYHLSPAHSPTAAQHAILASWLSKTCCDATP